MPENQNPYDNWSMDAEGSWSDTVPDERGFGILKEVLIRDATFDRMPRPIRQFSARVERLDAVGVDSVTGEKFPLSRYTGASLERQVKDESAPGGKKLVPAGKGKNKAAHIISNWQKAGVPLKDFRIPPPLDENGVFVPLPVETWVSPKDGTEKSANQVHIVSAEGVKVEYLFRHTVKFGGDNEAKNVLEIIRVMPPDFAVPEDQVQVVTIRRDVQTDGPPGEGSDTTGTAGASVADDAAHNSVILALIGHAQSEALTVLMQLPENLRVEPFVSGLSGEGAPLVQEYIDSGKLVVGDDGKLALPA